MAFDSIVRDLTAKWEDIDPSYRHFGVLTSFLLTLFLLLGFSLIQIFESFQIKRQFEAKLDIATYIKSAAEEMKTGSGAQSENADLSVDPQLFTNEIAGQINIQPSQIQVASGTPIPSQGVVQESLVKVQMSRVNIKQIIQFGIQAENNATPVKVRNIELSSEDQLGHFNANLNLSFFSLKRK
jgi:hypothetical protein